nr:FAD-dependent monooxygenase [uncultured Rhodopila sp.]
MTLQIKNQRVPVLIVGGGLAGLSAALLLAWRGVACLLVERRASTSSHPRARGVNLRSLELLRAIPGLEAELAAAGRPGTENFTLVVAESVTGREFHRMVTPGYIDPHALSPAAICTAGQDRIEPILLRYARDYGAEICFATELVDFADDERGVHALLRDIDTGKQAAIVADYLIAADGNRSPVRHRLGIGVHGHGTMSHNMSILFEADLGAVLRGRGFVHYQIQGPAFSGIFVSTDDPNVGQVAVEYDPALETTFDFPPERTAGLVRAALGVAELEVEVREVMPWQRSSQMADRMAEGRVFLVGDAAHTMPPNGGLGGQTAIQDAADIAWKLAFVLKDQAGPGLLDTYAIERHPVAERTVDRQTTVYLDRVRQRGAPQAGGMDASYLEAAMGYRYRSFAILDDAPEDHRLAEDPRQPSGRPGTRLPHAVVTVGDRVISTLDLAGAGFCLLAGPDGADWADAAATVAAQCGIEMAAYRAGADFAGDVPDFLARTGLGRDGALLIRPDGFIAWRGRTPGQDAAKILRTALGRALFRDIPAGAKQRESRTA